MILRKMSKKILISWLGITDLKAAGQILSRPDEIIGEGPILGALKTLAFDELHLINDQEQAKVVSTLNPKASPVLNQHRLRFLGNQLCQGRHCELP